MKFNAPFESKLIYVFRINDELHRNCLKIGETKFLAENILNVGPNSSLLNTAAKKRINQYTQTAAIAYDLLYTEAAYYSKEGIINSFSDKNVHDVLTRSGVGKKVFDLDRKANEWFITDLETVKNAIAAVKADKAALDTQSITKSQSPVAFRPEQKEAIDKTRKQFRKGDEMLWFAKMRFGKTLSALQVVKEMRFEKTLILTHRPVVDAGWFEDFGKIFYDDPGITYGSKNKGGTFTTLNAGLNGNKKRFTYFASIQDLRGSNLVGGLFEKNNDLFNTSWDFIIVDEAHEGTQTDLGKNVLTELKKHNTKILHLSGTPFNLLDNYKEEEIFTWDYVMEQRAKAEWDVMHFGDHNPYSSLPKLNIYTYDLGKILSHYVDEVVAFNFREFFRVKNDGSFLHEKDVHSFLDLICKENDESSYPFSKKEYRDNFRHSLWMVPGVKEAKALSTMLQNHTVFGHFKIVNVAGDGDEEQENDEALNKVQKAISDKPHETYSITISCGRLTTGVSVPAWTAVLMLSGSYKTSASGYMQTIFRVQTPATINGLVKEECFVFDFAPDRTLRVVAETAKISSKAGRTTSSDRQTMAEFLNFCPIISVDGSRMDKYNVERMLEQLKKVYIERVVRNGFEDGYLYNNDQLLSLEGVELNDFERLKGIIGTTKAMGKTGDIDINRQGFSNEEFEKTTGQTPGDQSADERTEEEKQIKKEQEKKRKNRESAISILRGISIRMPLLIYGADVSDEDNQITIDNFTELIDDRSWEEYMPAGVTKKEFSKFKKYYEPDVFRAAGKRIRAMARSADSLSIEERIGRITSIFGTFRNPDKETVLTPWRVVNMHISDCMGGSVFFDENFQEAIERPRFVDRGDVTKNIFSSDSTVLEINSKSGLYPLFMTYGIYCSKIQELPNQEATNLTQQQEIWDEVVKNNIFVICKTPMAKSITKRTLVGFREARVNTKYFEDLVNQITHKAINFIEKIGQGKTYWKSEYNNNMKFNAIVGNPPYMEMDGGASASAKPIYNHFVEISKKIAPHYISMIIPSRWYAGGKGLDDFRDKMLNDKHISVLHDFMNPEEIFPKTNIRGGICYFLWDKEHDSQKSQTKVVTHQINTEINTSYRSLKTENADTFIRHEMAISIISKIQGAEDFNTFATSVSVLRPFGLRGFFIDDEKFRPTDEGLKKPIICFGRGKKIGYMERNEIPAGKEWIDRFKVFTPRANNIGTELNDDNLNSFIGEPGTICTESYIVVGADLKLNRSSAENLTKYFRTKFVRFLHGISKAGQDATAKTYKFVPNQDFTSNSKLDWNNSIVEIDQQLYRKYKLNKEEVSFIENMIKSMK